MAVQPLIDGAHHVADGLGALAKDQIPGLGLGRQLGPGQRLDVKKGCPHSSPLQQLQHGQPHYSLIFQPSFCLTRFMLSWSVLPFLNSTSNCTRRAFSPCSCWLVIFTPCKPPLASIWVLPAATIIWTLPLTMIISLAETLS